MKRLLTSCESNKHNENNWCRKPRQYLNSIGHPVKVRWNGLGFNKNFHHQEGNQSFSYRHGLRNGKGNNEELGDRYHQKHMYPSQPIQRNSRTQEDSQDNFDQAQRIDCTHKEKFLDNAVLNSNYQHKSNDIAVNLPPMISVQNGTVSPQSFSNQIVPPPPLSMPPTNYGSIPSTYPLSMYPYLVLPPIGDSSSQVDYTAGPSQDPSGNDLPISDPLTLRYFYNLGYECYRLSNIHLEQIPQVPPKACLPSYSDGPMVFQGNPCPPPEEYWAECAEVDVPPSVIVQNEWSNILIGPPPHCPGSYQPLAVTPTGRIQNLAPSLPNGPPPVDGAPIYQPTTLPMQWNSLPLYTMPPPNCDA